MSRSTTATACIYAAMWAATCTGQDLDEAKARKALRETRMNLMRERVDSPNAVGASGKRLQFLQHPILRYGDTVRQVVDASVWALGRKGRPQAILALEIYREGSIQYEFTGTSELPKYVQVGTWRWEPRTTDFAWSTLDDEVPPSTVSAVRRRQMRDLARKFNAHEEFGGQTYQLRLMPRPILSYEDAASGIMAGALFVWAIGTNVEILMFIEARSDANTTPSWAVGFSRLAAAKLDVRLTGQQVWSSPASSGRPTRAYFYRVVPLTAEERAAFLPN
jgi:hypothetical protein